MRYTDVLISIRQIVRSVNLESKRIQKEYGISIPQLLCLNFLNEAPNYKATHKQIKSFLQLNASTVTGIITRLERKGLVARLPSENDRRVGYIVLTAQGAELLRKAPEPLHEIVAVKLKSLSDDDLKDLRRAFDTIIKFLEIDDVSAAPIITAATDITTSEEVDNS